jgi:hypothetical protein
MYTIDIIILKHKILQVMCMQYWPANKDKDEDYGGIGVSVLKEEELANFHIRTIKLYKKTEKDVRLPSLVLIKSCSFQQ